MAEPVVKLSIAISAALLPVIDEDATDSMEQ